ncbi:Alpha/Beta hydrolase protein [Rhizoctonia solani]|nr:Alpha/Beta hydrolase protein [Rhizoctonia solani]
MAPARCLALTTLTLLAVAQASAIPPSDGHHRYALRNNNLKWTNCSLDKYPGRECTRFEVPLDWHDDTAGKASLAVIRYPAIKEPKLGTLFMNPGGPGSSGVEGVQSSLGDSLMRSSGGQYDVVSWDPRGVGQSTPLTTCFATSEEEAAFWKGSFLRDGLEARDNFTSQTDLDEFYEQVDEVDDLLTRFGKQCVAHNPNAFKYVGTAAVVRDMVAMHDALEGPQKPINFWGISYGTVVGVYFVNNRVGRVVIDGVVNPIYWANRPAYEHMEVAFESSDEAFDGFAAACAKAGPSRCAIATQNSTQASVSQWTRDLINAAYDYRRVTGPSAQLSSASVRGVIFQALYGPEAWSNLAEYLKGASDFLRDPTSVNSAAIKRWMPRSVNPMNNNHKPRNEPNTTESTTMYAYEAVACADAQDAGNTTTKDVFDFVVKVTGQVSHMFGPNGVTLAGTYCHRWPVRAVERYTGPWNKKLSNPILVIGNEADPITPYVSAKHVADALGSSAVLIEQDDYGHGSLAMHSNCTTSALLGYFLRNRLPHEDEFCGTNQELFPKTGITKSTLRGV